MASTQTQLESKNLESTLKTSPLEPKSIKSITEQATMHMLTELGKNPSLKPEQLIKIFNSYIRAHVYALIIKEHWILIRNLIMRITCFGTIFGGCARDWYTRTSGADIFHKYCNEHGLDPVLHYNDKTCNPETYIHRTTLPNDIDIHISRSNYLIVLEILKSIFKKVVERNSQRPYNLNISRIDFKSYRCHIQSFDGVIKKLIDGLIGNFWYPICLSTFESFNIDFVIYEDGNTSESVKLPLNNKIDFLCNLLQLTRHGLETSGSHLIDEIDISIILKPSSPFPYEKFGIEITRNPYERYLKLYQMITKSILRKEAIAVQPDIHRIRKFTENGWTIDISYIMPPSTLIKYDAKLNPELNPELNPDRMEKCIICLGTFDNGENVYSPCFTGRHNIRDSYVQPCNAHVHLECLYQIFTQRLAHDANRYTFVPRCNHCNIEYIKESCHCKYMNIYLAHKFYLNRYEKKCRNEFLTHEERVYTKYQCRCPESIE
jgi:hypothetical protein